MIIYLPKSFLRVNVVVLVNYECLKIGEKIIRLRCLFLLICPVRFFWWSRTRRRVIFLILSLRSSSCPCRSQNCRCPVPIMKSPSRRWLVCPWKSLVRYDSDCQMTWSILCLIFRYWDIPLALPLPNKSYDIAPPTSAARVKRSVIC